MKTVQQLIKENRALAQLLANHAYRVRIGMRVVAFAQFATALGLFVVMKVEIFTCWPISALCVCGGIFLVDASATDWRKGNRYWSESMKERETLLDAAYLLEKHGLGK